GLAFAEKFRSEGQLRGDRLAGDVEGSAVIIVDDLISSGKTLARAAAVCRDRGARGAAAAVTHGVFSAEAASVLEGSALDRVVLLDTTGRALPGSPSRFDVLDPSPLVAEAIRRLHDESSLSELADA
ncbi:MAG TPA: phosphoribosyltransferase family protein, partial [Polyangiaceae bacterium]|nr:phosphoribosyltransferase family protein [Polyangiaceae bacterium]